MRSLWSIFNFMMPIFIDTADMTLDMFYFCTMIEISLFVNDKLALGLLAVLLLSFAKYLVLLYIYFEGLEEKNIFEEVLKYLDLNKSRFLGFKLLQS